MNTQIIAGDCLDKLRTLPDNSVDSIVTDPPYGLSNTSPGNIADTLTAWVTGDDTVVPEGKGFMGKSWDGFVPPPAVWKECMRVLKPGGHMAVFAGARTQDLMGLSIRLAGFEIRDTLGWIYGSGFPKSMDVSKAIDKAAGTEREVVGTYDRRSVYDMGDRSSHGDTGGSQCAGRSSTVSVTAPATSEAAKWAGWGTALKPAIEPIILARKPFIGTVANNVLAHGVGGLNIDASRVGTSGARQNGRKKDSDIYGDFGAYERVEYNKGRFPANVLLDEHAAAELDEQSGILKSGANPTRRTSDKFQNTYSDFKGQEECTPARGADSGGASRFFPVFKYQAKAPKKERPVIEREDGSKIQHPTVKPVALMEWLVELITPPGGTTLDPFAGSGTTLEAAQNKGFHAIGIEREPDYIQLIEQRLTPNTIF